MPRPRRPILLSRCLAGAGALVLLAACGLNTSGHPSPDDAGVDLPPADADGTIEPDVVDVVDVEPDVVDVEPDVVDVEPDAVDVVDVGPDVVDVGPDVVDVEPDLPEAEDAAEAEVPPVCDPGGLDDACSAGVMWRCRSDGSGFDETWCPFGCSGSGSFVRCFELDVPNVTDDALLWAGTAPCTTSGARVVVFETGTGAIRAWDALGAELPPLREAGEGDLGGIVFTVQAQGSGEPALGIWSCSEFAVAADTDAIGMGPRAMVILAAGEVRIDGRVQVGGSAAVLAGATWVGHDDAGPGGSPGGGAESSGGGAGGGGRGSEGDWAVDSGGGGGGFGGLGGTAGQASGHSGGAGGNPYGNGSLIPLVGGSGGGGGGDDSGGRGGHGGGALEIVGAGGVWVAAGGGINAGGGRGSGGNAAGGGGGGGSGGAVLLVGPRVDLMGGVAANGGGGGAGARSDSSGGNHGQPGQLATTAAAGGAGGGEGTSGGSGSDAGRLAGNPGESDGDDDDSGGGGGGAGRIRLDALVIGVGGFASPDEASTGTTRGTLDLY